MPAIRSVSWNATTVATGTTLTIPLPTYAQNDLLIAIIESDTTGGTWTSSGWTHVTGSPSANTSQLVVMYKIAGASETDPTFTATTAESYNGCIISIRDVNTTNPFGTTPVINFATQAAAAKFNMQQITTNVANALVLYAFANSSLGVTNFLEGPVYSLVAADGVAESLAVGWGFQPTAGLTPANVGCSTIVSGAGVKLALQIAPPSGGATVIPTYCAGDSSLYINPLNGTTAYNGDTAMAATADTNFGTSLGGKTAADGTVAAATDVGINSFHSVARLTSISGSKNMAGMELVLATANKPNVAGKNVLVHIGPSTEGQLQRMSSVASGAGVWFGMRSAASVYKIWQVWGVENGGGRHTPVVINSQAANPKATAGTLTDTSIAAFGFWVGGNGVTTTIWDFASLWALDTTIVAGGNATEPVDIPGIVAAAATGKERKSVVRQGAKQALVLGPIQFGNGGTNPIYMDLDATAIEFPRQANAAMAEVAYNSANNVAGLTYYAGATDTIKHHDSVVSSPSPYHWRIHASSNVAATYDFSGLQVIGAGDVQLRALNTAFAFMTFGKCGTVYANGAKIEDCEFKPAAGVTALSSGAPNLLKRNLFTSAGTGHGLVITTPGTYSFEGNTFTGYAATNGTTGNEAVYNNSGGAVTLNVTGATAPSIRNGAGATTTVNTAVAVTLENVIIGSRYRIYKKSDGSLLFEGEALSSQIDLVYGGATPTPVVVRVRKSASGTRYQPFETEGSITSTGLSVYVKQIPDTTAAPVVPVSISGTFSVASGAAVAFSTTDIPGASYTWSIPAGTASITSGQGTSSVSVTSSTIGNYTLKCVVTKNGWDPGSDSKTVTVTASQPIAMKTTALVKDSNYSQAQATTAKISPSVSVQAGDLILVVHTNDQAVATACTDNAAGGSNTYRRVGNGSFISNATTSITAFYAIAKATETIQATVTTTGTTYFTTSVILISGANQNVDAVLDQFAYQTAEGAGSTAHTSASITTTNPDDLIICWWAEDTASSGVTENGQGFTELPGSIDSYSNGACTTCMYKVVSSTGTYYDQMTSSASTFFTSLIMAFKKA